MIANFHPLAALQVFSTIEKPDGYPDAMLRNSSGLWKKNSSNTESLNTGRLCTKLKSLRMPNQFQWFGHSAARDPARNIIKWKAHLCVGGHRQIYGDTYWRTFAPVMSWTIV